MKKAFLFLLLLAVVASGYWYVTRARPVVWQTLPHCPKCDTRLNPLTKPDFCGDCGQNLSWDQTEAKREKQLQAAEETLKKSASDASEAIKEGASRASEAIKETATEVSETISETIEEHK